MLHAEFRLLYNLANRHEVALLAMEMPQVPSEGQIVNIEGNPYRVVAVAWSVLANNDQTYVYINVQKASDFTVIIGGHEY